MAEVRLAHHEVMQGNLPPICMRCGAPATTYGSKTFTWHPNWLLVFVFFGVLPYFIMVFALEKRIRLLSPLCAKHANHWRKRRLLLWCLFGVVAVLVGLWFALIGQKRPGETNPVAGMVCVSVSFVGFLWLIVAVICHETSIHAKEVTEHSLTLARVSDEFAQAVFKSRPGRRDDDYPEALPGDPRGGGSEQYFDPKS